ncbi:MAG: hydrogenase iron-sulfur subunit, partial [Anaerolineales bacterium]|nr:hydrogenase iron-sulfur subunit [Anaerolineales bacterium]
RNTVRRVDALWEGLEKQGVRPERLQLDWCSAAEGQKWAKIMNELEELRSQVTAAEADKTKQLLKGKKAPIASKVWRLKEPTKATLQCMRCNYQWPVTFDLAADQERMCPQCRNNGVRVLLDA